MLIFGALIARGRRRTAVMARDVNVHIAVRCLNRLLRSDPADADALRERTQIYVDLKRYERAIAGYSKLLQLVPVSDTCFLFIFYFFLFFR
jgi:regulator of sirC expression with transglutaminase-like and TPR domain